MLVTGFQGAAKIPELRKRIFFTLLMLIIYRVGIFVPVPGIDAERVKSLFDQASGTIFGMVNMFSGGALKQASVFALGVMPYISVSIIIQLLTAVWPWLEEKQKEGEAGRRAITRYTRIGTVILALFQGMMISISLEKSGYAMAAGWSFRFLTTITLCAGTVFIMWLGEQITERGIGNGISLIITAGILASMPGALAQTFELMRTGEVTPMALLAVLLFGAATIAAIVYVERSQRKIPVQYPRRAMGGKVSQPTAQHLPLKLNSSGVMPPIFASALMFFPATIAHVANVEWLNKIQLYLHPGSGWFELAYGIMILFFSYFYAAIQFDPDKIAENLKKQGGFVPAVRPGKDTANYINDVMTRLTLWGGLYLVAICIIPTAFYIFMGVPQFSYFFGGTAVLIAVGVTLDTISQMESHIVARNYESFMKKSPGKVRAGARASHVRGRLIQR